MRRQSRELAFQILFQAEFAPQISVHQLTELLGSNSATEMSQYADVLVRGVLRNKESIDAKIQAASRHWKIERMGGVDRNVMRVAVYEIFMADELLDPKIVINEAIEIAKIFGSQESSGFVNGILDQVVKNERR